MFIDTTMQPKVDELLKGMIVQSGNDASVALAEGVGGSVEPSSSMMNRQAQAWGLKNTQFRNVTGLTEPGHHSSARDLAVIAANIMHRLSRALPATIRCATTASTTSSRTTATCCWAATRRSTA
jgi:D-alanyl-D-alanine carboxypeptidase (penicillin-binding protein 5/6)